MKNVEQRLWHLGGKYLRGQTVFGESTVWLTISPTAYSDILWECPAFTSMNESFETVAHLGSQLWIQPKVPQRRLLSHQDLCTQIFFFPFALSGPWRKVPNSGVHNFQITPCLLVVLVSSREVFVLGELYWTVFGWWKPFLSGCTWFHLPFCLFPYLPLSCPVLSCVWVSINGNMDGPVCLAPVQTAV